MNIQAKAEMLIGATPCTVFNAFANKETISKFWLDYASDDLSDGVKVEWRFMVSDARETVNVTKFVTNKSLSGGPMDCWSICDSLSMEAVKLGRAWW